MTRKNKLASSLGAFLRVLCDLMVLNVLWLICCIPVITVGPATSALCCVSLKLARGEPTATVRTFFDALKQNFVQALLLGLIGLAGFAVAVVDWLFALSQQGSLRTLYFVVGVIVSAVVLAYWAWVFALNAGFENSLVGTIKNALSLAFVEPGKTLLINHFRIQSSDVRHQTNNLKSEISNLKSQEWHLVDLPGYGYAQAGQKQREALKRMIERYCLMREQLVCLFVLIDCRHEPQKIDLEFINWLGENGVPFAIVFTKGDKLGRMRLKENVEA